MTLLLVTFTILLLLRTPIAFSLFMSSMVYLIANDISPVVAIQRIAAGPDSFALIAIPGFVLAGAVMNTGGVTTRLFEFANKCVGHLTGGLGHANVLAGIIFAGMSGSAVADAAGLGAIEIKAMKDAGFDEDFTVGVTGASALIGPIIPPSIPAVIFGVISGVSIGKLFAAGFIPGLLMGAALSIMVYIHSKKRGYPRPKRATLVELWVALRRAFFPLLTPIIIVGGIVLGVFTPTEGAIITVVYSLVLAAAYKSLTAATFVSFMGETFRTTVTVMFIIASASIFGYILTIVQVPQQLAAFFLSTFTNPYLALLVINIMVLIAGCFMESVSAMMILTPVLMPVITGLGIDPVHFGIVFILNLMIGLLTPPVGMVLYVLSTIAKRPVDWVSKACFPYVAVLIVVLIVITYVPQTALFLPNLLFGGK